MCMFFSVFRVVVTVIWIFYFIAVSTAEVVCVRKGTPG
jgi:hypothetical protein